MKALKSPANYCKFPAAFALAASFLLMTHSLLAATFMVTTLADNQPNAEPVPGSLRDAIETAQSGDTILITVSGTITLNGGELDINQNPLSISGPGVLSAGSFGDTAPDPANLVISGNGSGRVFNVAAGAVVTLNNLTITNGLIQGSIGGQNGSDTFGTAGRGGGIINRGNLTLTWCTITGNSAVGGQFVSPNNGGNGGDGDGGGIYNSGTLTLNGCAISHNNATGGHTSGNGFNDLFQLNTSYGGDGDGGGIFNAGVLVLSACTFSCNSANGADETNGLTDSYGDIGGDGNGGGIFNLGGLTLVNCTIANNNATGGGAVCYALGTQLGLTAYGQSGNGYGGGINSFIGSAFLDSCTLSLNAATGGNIFDASYIFGVSCTAGNGSGGGIAGLQIVIENTIVAGNTANPGSGLNEDSANGTATGFDVLGWMESNGFNFIGQTDGSFGWNASSGNEPDQTGTTFRPLDPNLGPLQNNTGPPLILSTGGGQTETMALLETPGIPNPAVDKGNSFGLTSDERGLPRPVKYNPNLSAPGDYSDIGAYELQASSPSMTATPDSPTNFPYSTITSSSGKPTKISFTNPYPWWLQTNQPIFGLETLIAGEPFNHDDWTPFTGALRYYNGNSQFVVTDTNDAKAGRFYRAITPATNMLYILPAATTPATSVTSSQATLNGTTTPYGVNTIYWFEFGANTNYGLSTVTNSLTTVTNPTQITSLSVPISGLTRETLYHYQLVVIDNDGTQYGGDQSFEFGPPAVTTLMASSVTTNAAVANGSINPNGASTRAYFEYGQDTNYGYATVSNNIGIAPQGGFSTAITGLSPGTVYHYRADAFNSNGISYGTDAAFTTVAAPSAATLAAQSITTCKAVLLGSVDPMGAETTWAFQWGTTTNYAQNTPPLLISPYTNTMVPVEYQIGGLLPSTVYHYQIVATNSAGSSIGGDQQFTTLAPQPTCVPPPAGLVNWWPANGNADDIIGGDYGALEGEVTYADGEGGEAFSFNGTNGYVSTSLEVTNPQIFSLSLWFQTTTTNGGVLISFDSDQLNEPGSSYDRNIYMDDTGALHFGVWNSGPQQINSAASYNDGNWHYVVGSLSTNTGLSLYIDGALVGNKPSVTNAQEVYNGYWRIGQDNLDNWPSQYQPNSEYFQGQIDEVAIFNTALASTNVTAIYDAGSVGMCQP
jgi:hypothetical protein